MSRLSPPDVASVMGLLDTYIRWRQTQAPPRGHLVYHPSAFGKCLRRMQYQRYQEMGIKDFEVENESHNSQLLRLFETGHHYQERWTRYFDDIGILRGIWSCSNMLCYLWDDEGNFKFDQEKADELLAKKHTRFHGKNELRGCMKPKACVCGSKRFDYHEVRVVLPELNFAGSADLLLDFTNFDPKGKFDGVNPAFKVEDLPKGCVVADMKTINDRRFTQELLKSGPSVEYILQLTIYANVLDCEGGLLIYENKNSSETAAFKVHRAADTIWPLIQTQARKMIKMAGGTTNDKGEPVFKLPPPRPFRKDDYECKKCEFRNTCHSSAIWQDPKLMEKRKKFYGTLLGSH